MAPDVELLGGWIIVHAIDGGRRDGDLEDCYYWFEEGGVTLGDPTSFGKCRYRTDPTCSPPQFDIWGGEDDPFHQSGIYARTAGELTICCVDGDQQERPTSFESDCDNGWVLYQLRRTDAPTPA